MAMFQDDSTDDETCYLQLGERLRINRGDLVTNHSNIMNGKEKKQLFNQHRQNHILDDQSSSSSSLDMQNDSFFPGPVSARSLQNKKRQNGDKPIDQLTNPKRTCLDDACQRSPGFSGCRRKTTNGDIPHSRKIMDFSSEAPNSSSLSLFPDKTYEDHLSQTKPTKDYNLADAEDSDVEVWPRQNMKPTAKDTDPQNSELHEMPLAKSKGVQLIDSTSEEDSRLMPSGALKGGRQSPDPSTSKKVMGRKVKRVLDSDDSESEDWPAGYRARPLIFSSSDSEDSKSFARLKNKSSDIVSKKSANLSFSSGDSQKSGLDHNYHRAGGSSSFFDNHFANPPTPPRTNYRTRSPSYKSYKTRSSNRTNGLPTPSILNSFEHSIIENPEIRLPPTLSLATQRRTLRSSRLADSRLGTDLVQQQNSGADSHGAGSSGATSTSHHFPSTSTLMLPHSRNVPEVPPVSSSKPIRGISKKLPDTSASSSRRLFGRARPLRPKPNLAAAHPDIFDDGDSSEVEFFTANSYSDNESNTEPYSNVVLDPIGSQPDPHSPVPAEPSINVVSSEDEISVVYTKGPKAGPPPWSYQSRRGASRTLGRRYNRGSRRHLSRSQDVSLSPDPVEQVRQVEEDERFARMLQAQFDAEVDPTFVPRPHLSPNPCQMNIREYSSSDDSSSIPDFPDEDALPFIAPYARRIPHARRRNNYAHHVFGSDAVVLPRRNFNVRINVSSSRPVQLIDHLRVNRQEAWHPLLGRNVLINPLNLFSNDDDESYEAFLGLADMNGDVVRGLQKSQINRLPTRKYIPMNSASTSSAAELPHKRAELNKECQVCLNDYTSGDVLRILPCFHEFHTPCIDPWLKINHTCPVCRVVVDLED